MAYPPPTPEQSAAELAERQMVAAVVAGILAAMNTEQIFNLDGVPLDRTVAKAEAIVAYINQRANGRTRAV